MMQVQGGNDYVSKINLNIKRNPVACNTARKDFTTHTSYREDWGKQQKYGAWIIHQNVC